MPEWLRVWLQHNLLPALGMRSEQVTLGILKGIYDTLLLVLLGSGFLVSGRFYMDSQYALPRNTQAAVLKWAPISDQIARKADIPRFCGSKRIVCKQLIRIYAPASWVPMI